MNKKSPQWAIGRQQNINAGMLSNGSAYNDAVVAHGNYQREKEAYNYANSTYAWDSKGLKSYEPFATFSDWYNKYKEINDYKFYFEVFAFVGVLHQQITEL